MLIESLSTFKLSNYTKGYLFSFTVLTGVLLTHSSLYLPLVTTISCSGGLVIINIK